MTNPYELAHRAMALQDSIKCGPEPKFCDGGKPAYTCPAHGGDYSDSDNWRPEDSIALQNWCQRWETEVGR